MQALQSMYGFPTSAMMPQLTAFPNTGTSFLPGVAYSSPWQLTSPGMCLSGPGFANNIAASSPKLPLFNLSSLASTAVVPVSQTNQVASTDSAGNISQQANLFPAPHERMFASEHMTGKVVIDLRNWMIIECNKPAQDILQKPLIGNNLFEGLISPLTSIAGVLQVFPSLKMTGEVWTRDTITALDGSQKSLLRKTKFSDSITALSEFQLQ